VNSRVSVHVAAYLADRSRLARNGCVEWTGPILNSGYGAAHVAGMKTTAHRVAFIAAGKDIPPGMELDHLCRNRICVNVAHLEPVTRKQNMERTPIAQADACAHGHLFTPENTYVKSNGCRSCRTCNAARQQALRDDGRDWYSKNQRKESRP